MGDGALDCLPQTSDGHSVTLLLVQSLRICPDVSGARMHPMLYPEDFTQINTIFEAEAMLQGGEDEDEDEASQEAGCNGTTRRPPLKPTRSIAFEAATAAAALPLRSLKRMTTSNLKGFSSNYATNRSERKVCARRRACGEASPPLRS